MTLLLIALIWTGCGVLAFGMTLGYFCRRFASITYVEAEAQRWPHHEPDGPHTSISIALAWFQFIAGPIGVLVALTDWRPRYGLKYRWWIPEPYTPELWEKTP